MWQRFREWRRAARARETKAYDAYLRIVTYPLFVLGLLFLIAFAIMLTPNPDDAELRFARVVIPVTWLIFAIDYAIGIMLAPDRWHYVRSHVLQATALLFPPLRILMLFHVLRVLQSTPIRRGDRARTYVLYATTLLLAVSSILMVYFERKAPNANITSFGDALWWGGETVSTVGYGDYYPVTVPGRLVAAVLFVNGVALLSIITAGLAQNFHSDDDQRKKNTGAAQSGDAGTAATHASGDQSDGQAGDDDHVTVSRSELQQLHGRLASLERTLSEMTDRVTAALAQSVSVLPPPDSTAQPDRRAEPSGQPDGPAPSA